MDVAEAAVAMGDLEGVAVQHGQLGDLLPGVVVECYSSDVHLGGENQGGWFGIWYCNWKKKGVNAGDGVGFSIEI